MATRSRQERSVRTREAILQAATECLVEFGYGRTTMAKIQRAAGISRGALTHQFGSMNHLLVAATESIAQRHGHELEQTVEAAGEGRSLDVLVESLHRMMQRPVFLAGLELWAAARTDPELRAALSASARTPDHKLRESVRLAFDPPIDDARLSVAYDGLMSLLRGLALGSVIRERPDREREILRDWLTQFTHARHSEGARR